MFFFIHYFFNAPLTRVFVSAITICIYLYIFLISLNTSYLYTYLFLYTYLIYLIVNFNQITIIILIIKTFDTNYKTKTFMGDGVAERNTASVPTLTIADSNLDHGRLLSLGRQLSRAIVLSIFRTTTQIYPRNSIVTHPWFIYKIKMSSKNNI